MDTLKTFLAALAGGKDGETHSRKWMALVLAGTLTWFGKLPPEYFAGLCAAYMGVQGFIDSKTNGKAPVEPPKP